VAAGREIDDRRACRRRNRQDGKDERELPREGLQRGSHDRLAFRFAGILAKLELPGPARTRTAIPIGTRNAAVRSDRRVGSIRRTNRFEHGTPRPAQVNERPGGYSSTGMLQPTAAAFAHCAPFELV
jgi:hypothetical protein